MTVPNKFTTNGVLPAGDHKATLADIRASILVKGEDRLHRIGTATGAPIVLIIWKSWRVSFGRSESQKYSSTDHLSKTKTTPTTSMVTSIVIL